MSPAEAMSPARVLALILAAVFVVAAGAKLRSPRATAAELAELRLRFPAVLAWLLPAVELGVAATLVAAPAWGGIVAFALLAAFTAVLVGVVRSGRSVSCRCFGGLSTKPISRTTLARNGALLAMAAGAALV